MGEENFSISWLAPMGEKLYFRIMWEGEMHEDLAPMEGML
jgi:hypothetical protein